MGQIIHIHEVQAMGTQQLAIIHNLPAETATVVGPDGTEFPMAPRVLEYFPEAVERLAVHGPLELWRLRGPGGQLGRPAPDAEILDLYHNAPPAIRLLLTVLLRSGTWRG